MTSEKRSLARKWLMQNRGRLGSAEFRKWDPTGLGSEVSNTREVADMLLNSDNLTRVSVEDAHELFLNVLGEVLTMNGY